MSVFRSNSRSRYTRSIKRQSPTKHRPQRVKFRRRYANSIARKTVTTAVKLTLSVSFLAACYMGLKTGHQWWENSSFWQIKKIEYQGDVPQDLIELWSLKEGQKFWAFDKKKLLAAAQQKFPEFESLSLSRTLGRNIVVKAKYRTVLATLKDSSPIKAIDISGTIFPMKEPVTPALPVPTVSGSLDSADLAQVATFLNELQKHRPEFFALIKEVKTDKILPSQIVLQNNIYITWPNLSLTNAMVRSDALMKFFQHYAPSQDNASLRFVADDRLIMDAHWKLT